MCFNEIKSKLTRTFALSRRCAAFPFQVAVSGLSETQAMIVHENANDIEANVSPKFKLDWRVIKFQSRLGSGTFGDCYKGLLGEKTVAVSDHAFFVAFSTSASTTPRCRGY